jgi:hypothetical protein
MAVLTGMKFCKEQSKWLWLFLQFTIITLVLSNQAFADLEITQWILEDPYESWAWLRSWSETAPGSEVGRLEFAPAGYQRGPVWVVGDVQMPEVSSFSLTIEVQDTLNRNDDDFIGFCFGYQDNSHFYLVDWRGPTEEYNWGDPSVVSDDIAEEGLKLKRIDGSWTRDGLWGGTDGIGVTTLAGAEGEGWQYDTQYNFEVSMSPERILVTLDGVEVFNVVDNSFRGGTIALYALSQDGVIFSNITVIPEPASFFLLGLGGLVLLRKRR